MKSSTTLPRAGPSQPGTEESLYPQRTGLDQTLHGDRRGAGHFGRSRHRWRGGGRPRRAHQLFGMAELAAGRQGTTACRGAAVWSSVRYGHRPQRLSHHYLSKQRTAGTLELGDTPQEQTVGRKEDRRRLPVGWGRPICGEARAGRISCRFVERGKAEVTLRQLAAVFDTAPLMQINGPFWHQLPV